MLSEDFTNFSHKIPCSQLIIYLSFMERNMIRINRKTKSVEKDILLMAHEKDYLVMAITEQSGQTISCEYIVDSTHIV